MLTESEIGCIGRIFSIISVIIFIVVCLKLVALIFPPDMYLCIFVSIFLFVLALYGAIVILDMLYGYYD